MISVHDAQKLTIGYQLSIFSRFESVAFQDSFGRVLAEDLFADRDYPPFNRSMMDGICLNFADIKDGIKKFDVKAVIAAGESCDLDLASSECFEIMTGAMVPGNCNIVIPYEHIEKVENQFVIIKPIEQYRIFENIHLEGSDLKFNDIILKKDVELTPTHLAIAASIGANNIHVYTGPRIAVVSTGNELVDIDVNPKKFQIRRSNSYALKAALNLFGFQDVKLFHINDDYDGSKNFILESLQNFDYIFFSGGVSKGKFDYLPKVFEELEITKIFHGVAQRPGKPLWFGRHNESNTNVVGLPGNPISSLVCLYKYFLPIKPILVELAESFEFKNKLTYFLPVIIRDQKAYPNTVKNSGEFAGLAYTDGFIELPADDETFSAGEKYFFYIWKKIDEQAYR